MHDTRLDHNTGWPDLESAASVVRCVKQSVTVASNQAPGQNWDCHIVQWPWLDALNFKTWSRPVSNRVLNTPVGVFNQGGLQIYGTTAGVALNPIFGGITQLALDPSYSQGPGRVVGLGFEVINTTAELNQQGLVTVYRQNQPHMTPTCMITETFAGTVDLEFTAQTFRAPPFDTPTALLIPGSRQWKAKEGCYVVQTFVGQDNPPKVVDFTAPVVLANDDVTGGAGTNTGICYAPATGLITATIPAINIATKIYPIHMGGAIFSGLSPTSTLTINYNIYYETFPTPSEPGVLVLAKPSCPYDPVALEIFSRAMSKMPVGVPSADNASGDWFNTIIAFIKEAAPFLAAPLAAINPLFGPLAAGVGMGAGAYLSNQTTYGKPKNKAKKQMKAPALPPRDEAYWRQQFLREQREEARAKANVKRERRNAGNKRG